MALKFEDMLKLAKTVAKANPMLLQLIALEIKLILDIAK